jgi:hypothetical protein
MNESDVEAILAGAVKAVADAKVPDDLRSMAFEKAVDLLAGRTAPAAVASVAPASAVPIALPAGGDVLGKLAARLDLSREVVEEVYAEGRDGLQVNVKPERLARSKSAGTRELAMLVAAMDQADSDDPTTADEIRRVVEEYNRYDSPNFASTLAGMKGPLLPAGSSRSRTFRLTRPGWSEASRLVARLAGTNRAVA